MLLTGYCCLLILSSYGSAYAVFWTQLLHGYAHKCGIYICNVCVCVAFFYLGLIKCQAVFLCYLMNNITRVYSSCVCTSIWIWHNDDDDDDADDNVDDVDATQKNEAGVKRWISYIYINIVGFMMRDFLEIVFIYFSMEIGSKSIWFYFCKSIRWISQNGSAFVWFCIFLLFKRKKHWNWIEIYSQFRINPVQFLYYFCC